MRLNKNKQNIIWLAANRFGFELLKQAHTITPGSFSAIITLDEQSTTKMYDGVEYDAWNEFSLPVHRVMGCDDIRRLVRSLEPDFLFVCGWRQMLDEDLLGIPKKGTIGFHPTLLPKGRGSAPIINTILTGVRDSGVTMFYLNKKVDGGDIIAQKGFSVDTTDTARTIYNKVVKTGRILIKNYLSLLLRDKAPRIPQDDNEATYFPPRSLKDNELLPTDTLDQMYIKIKAFTKPYRGAFMREHGKKLILWDAELQDEH